jgi:hypothetical protein
LLRCPACGRSGGPFCVGPQAWVDRHLVRSWQCHCHQQFYALAGAERSPAPQPAYTGFLVEFNGRSHPVALRRMAKLHTLWQIGPFSLAVDTHADANGCRPFAIGRLDESAHVVRGASPPKVAAVEILPLIKSGKRLTETDADLLARAVSRVLS